MFFNLFLFGFSVLVEGKAIFDLHMLHKFAGDFERVRYGFLEHASSSYLSCPENTKKNPRHFLFKCFNYYRFYGESESRLRQIFAEASLRYVLLDNYIHAHFFAVLVPELMVLKEKHLQESLNCSFFFFLQWFLKGNKCIYVELSKGRMAKF